MITEGQWKRWKDNSTTDDRLNTYVLSDIRQMLGEIERLRARDYELRTGLHIARGALLGIGTDYAKEVADHLAGVLDPSLATGERPNG